MPSLRKSKSRNGPGPAQGSGLQLSDGSRVAVIGGGPAGSLFSYFLLEMAGPAGIQISVDIYEPKDFSKSGTAGCNRCGGVISESLVQMLAMDGIFLPSTVVQQGIDTYILHTDEGSAHMKAPGIKEKRIASVRRSAGPAGITGSLLGNFDGFLLGVAGGKGATVITERVEKVFFSESGKPCLATKSGIGGAYDLVVGAAGVKSADLNIFENLGFGYRAPKTTKTFITEIFLGREVVDACLGHTMHLFLLDLPRLKFAAIIPKGEYVTVCLLGRSVDLELADAFFSRPEVTACFPAGSTFTGNGCRCFPAITIGGAKRPFGDRFVMIGDCGVSRLYKDGIGAAYLTAKAAANTVLLSGVAADDFRRHYLPVCRAIARDNQVGKVIYAFTRLVQRHHFLQKGMLRMVAGEQTGVAPHGLSGVLWDTFTGSSTYTNVFSRMVHPLFLGRWLYETVMGFLSPAKSAKRGDFDDGQRVGKKAA